VADILRAVEVLNEVGPERAEEDPD